MRAIELYEYHETSPVIISPDIIKKIKSECSIALSKDPIYRGLNQSNDILYGNPIKPRSSANTYNYYTTILDELPSWQKFPKRSLSWICSTSENTASGYGTVYRVLPVNNPLISIASSDDLWFSFSEGLHRTLSDIHVYDLFDFSRLLHDIFAIGRRNGVSVNVKSLGDMNNTIELIIKQNEIESITRYERYQEFFTYVQKAGSFINLVSTLFDPKINHIELVDLNKFIAAPSREVWFTGPAYFIQNTHWGKMFKNKYQ